MNIKELKTYYHTDKYIDRSLFAAKARLLQSIWRGENNIPYLPELGNYLNDEYAYTLESNFLTPKIREYVKNELNANDKRFGKDKKVIKKDRLYENLLASQPLAFNLFVELITPDFALATKVFKEIFGNMIQKITSIDFEISPGRKDEKYIGDRSAFDVFIKYDGIKGKGFMGIEVKYSETLKDEPASFKNRYKEVAKNQANLQPKELKISVKCQNLLSRFGEIIYCHFQ